MTSKKTSTPNLPAARTGLASLKPSQQIVVQAFLDPHSPGYLNQTQAYKQAHPGVKDTTAATEGHTSLRNPKVRAVVSEELEARGWDKERILAELNWNVNECKTLKKLGDHREGVGLIAKVTGNLIEKREVKTLQDDERDSIRRIISESLRSTN